MATAPRPPRLRVAAWVATPFVGTLFRLVLAGVFLYAGAAKVGRPDASVRAVTAYRVLPTEAARIVGYALPGLEIALGLLLLVGLLTRAAAGTLAVLVVVFLIGIGQAWVRGLSIDCGCFGGGGAIDPAKTRYLQEVLRDAGLLLMALWLVLFPRTRLSVDAAGSLAGHEEDLHGDDDTDDDTDDETDDDPERDHSA